MTIDFDIKRLVPRFLYDDKNGYAMCMAIQAAFEYVAEKVEEGIAILQDPDRMPEWRLDEMAEEYNILYDYHADIEVKRDWIKNARKFFCLYGKAAGVVQYLEAAFDSVTVEESWEYGGDPFHFRVIVTGEWSDVADEWAQNVRSVLDNIIFNAGSTTMDLNIGFAVCGVEIEDTALMM